MSHTPSPEPIPISGPAIAGFRATTISDEPLQMSGSFPAPRCGRCGKPIGEGQTVHIHNIKGGPRPEMHEGCIPWRTVDGDRGPAGVCPCGRPFVIHSGMRRDRAYCCEEHRTRAATVKRAQAEEPRDRGTECGQCGARFTPARSDARYCSARCRVAAHRAAKGA